MGLDFECYRRSLRLSLPLVKAMDEGAGVMSRLRWKMLGSESIEVDSIRITDGRYLSFLRGSNQRLMAFLRIRVEPLANTDDLDYSSTVRITLQQQRMKGLFDGLYKVRVPMIYLSLARAADVRKDSPNGVFEFDLAVGTWMDGRVDDHQRVEQTLEQNANVISATLSVALPNSSVRRLTRKELSDFTKSILLPNSVGFPQDGSSSTVSTLESFDDRSPMVHSVEVTPEFYIPNSAESGTEGVLLGRIKTRSGELHEFRFLLDDLRRHAAILGMTGAGKSTTAAVIVKQVAEMGMTAMILDWHNEYERVVKSVGGRVISPVKDRLVVNPIEVGASVDPAEHLALVTDIFADIYKFTHPQAFMFRNALQRCLNEAAEEEIPTLSSLIKVIESFPLRSAYDNETKVALLRRLVPLTQGQVGMALDGPASHSIDDLLESVVAVELGEMRDFQTRSIFAEILLKMVYENRVSRRGPREHLLVIEEARNLAPMRREDDPPSVGERMISELRKFGEATHPQRQAGSRSRLSLTS
jgi:hypothetical protein